MSGSPPIHVATDESPHELARRLLAVATELPLWKLERQGLEPHEWPHVARTTGMLAGMPVTLELLEGSTLEILERLAGLGARPGLAIVLLTQPQDAQSLVRIVAEAPISSETALLVCATCPAPRTARSVGAVDVLTFELHTHPGEYTGDIETYLVGEHHPPGKGGRLVLASYEPYLHRIDPLRAPEYPFNHACDDEDASWAATPLPPERRLDAPAPPRAKPMHANAHELSQTVRYAASRAQELDQPDRETTIGLFLAYMLPYFKWAACRGHAAASISKDCLDNAVRFACNPFEDESALAPLLELTGIEQVSSIGHYGGVWQDAAFKLPLDCIPFGSDTPKKALHIRTHRGVDRSKRWASLVAAASSNAMPSNEHEHPDARDG